VTLTASPDGGFSFREWTGDGTGNPTRTVESPLGVDQSVTAVFTETYDATITGQTVAEGGGNPQNAFAVTLNKNVNPLDAPVVVSGSLADGTAKAGQDYTAGSGSVDFLGGEGTTAKYIETEIADDAYVEEDETFTVSVSSYNGGGSTTITDATITDNDSATVSIAKTTDGSEGGANGEFNVTQTAESSTDTVLSYSVGGTAASGSDYTALSHHHRRRHLGHHHRAGDR